MTEDLNTMSLADLKNLKKKVDKAIDSFETRRKLAALEALQATAREQGFNLSELLDAAQSKPKSAPAAKYANPENKNQTWSGRGRKPAWFIDAIHSGKSDEDLAI